MFPDILILILGATITFAASLLLTNAIEYIERKTNLGESFTGSIIAPLFTSIPELVIFLTSIFVLHSHTGNEIGIGTLFGQPFMTATISYGLVGVAVLLGFTSHKRNRITMHVDKNLAIPYIFISSLFPLLLLPGTVNFISLQYALGGVFLISYFVFAFVMYKKRTFDEKRSYITLLFAKRLSIKIALALQLVAIVAGLYFGSNYMVNSLASISTGLGLNALGLSILIIPVATSIPETLSAIIWAFKGNDSLSISSLVGEKALYSTFYPGLGLLLIQWINNQYSEASIIFTTIISLIFLVYIRMQKIPIYILFMGVLFFIIFVLLFLHLQFQV